MHQKQKYIKLKTFDLNNQAQYLNIILNRPEKRNALNPKMISEIISAFDEHEKLKKTKLILISSSSSVFCAGADLLYLKKLQNYSYQENLNDSYHLMSLYKKMLKYPKLIISKVCGPAIAGGCGLINACDLVFATKNSKFSYPEVKLGFIPALVSTFLLTKIKGSDARELLLTGKLIDAIYAEKIGLINKIYELENIDNEIIKFIKNIVRETSINSVKETKEMIYQLMDLDKKLETAAKLNAKSRDSEDFTKGITNFLEKNKINWAKQ